MNLALRGTLTTARKSLSAMVLHPLGGEKLVNRPHRDGIGGGDADRASSRKRVDAVANGGTPLPHHRRSRQLVLMHLEGVREIPRGESLRNVLYVGTDRPHAGAVLRVADQ